MYRLHLALESSTFTSSPSGFRVSIFLSLSLELESSSSTAISIWYRSSKIVARFFGYIVIFLCSTQNFQLHNFPGNAVRSIELYCSGVVKSCWVLLFKTIYIWFYSPLNQTIYLIWNKNSEVCTTFVFSDHNATLHSGWLPL